MLTTLATAAVPNTQLARVRETYPELKGLSNSKVIRFAISLALGMNRAEALASTGDPRRAETRKLIESV